MRGLNIIICLIIVVGFTETCTAQTFDPAVLRDNYNMQRQGVFAERIYAHTDKELYVAGEIAWFKLYCVNSIDFRPVNLSKVAYVEILDATNKPVEQAKIEMLELGGAGSFYLPVTLETGNYILRAYTSWMKNSGPDVFFEKQITIVNTLKSPPGISVDSTLIHASFFPEGGNLVVGLRSKIAIKTYDKRGAALPLSGIIISSKADTIVRFSVGDRGIANFELTPQQGERYTAVLMTASNKSVRKQLPDAYEEGYVMRVSGSDAQALKVDVEYKFKDGFNKPVYLVVHDRKAISIAERSVTNSPGTASFAIGRDRLGKGIQYLTIFDEAGQPKCERLIFNGVPPMLPVTVATAKGDYVTRDKVELAIKGSALGSNNLSVSVYADETGDAPGNDIQSYFWLESELPGSLTQATSYLAGRNSPEAMDNLLLTEGWRKFDWNAVKQNAKPVLKYAPEYHGQIITARVTTLSGAVPKHKVDVYLSIPGSKAKLFMSETDANGIAYFEVKDYYRLGDVYPQIIDSYDSTLKVQLLSPYYEEAVVGGKTNVSDEIYPNTVSIPEIPLSRKNIGMQVQNLYVGDSMQHFVPVRIKDTLPFFGRAEYVYNLDDYTRFTTMEEVLREYVVAVNVGVKNTKLQLKIFNAIKNDFAEDNVLVMLDGVVLKDKNKIFEYDPLKIKKIEVVPQAYVLNAVRFEGVVNFTTYEEVFDGYELDPGLLSIDYDGLQLQRSFYAPEYGSKERLDSKLPDFRNTLYWNPFLRTDKEGNTNLSFYTGDVPGNYRVVIQGINPAGGLISTSTTFTVKRR
jgi:hypothetical protein